jgi:hypothetical protein
MTAATEKPLSQRINVRLIVFLAIVAAPFVGFLYAFVNYNGGIQRTHDGLLVDLKALGNFEFDQNDGTIASVPPKFRELDGKKVVLEGFMYSRLSAVGTGNFEFVYNVQKCCFNGPPLVQERVFVKVPEGKNLDWYSDMCRLIGTLHVQVVKEHGIVIQVYTLDPDRTEKTQ